MQRHFSVEVGFAGYINGYETVDVYVDPDNESYWNEDDLEESLCIFIQDPDNDIASDLLSDVDVEETADGEYEVTYNFATYIGLDETYSVYADSEEDAIDEAFQEACNDLTVESYEEIFDIVNTSTRLRRSRRITASIDPSAPDWLREGFNNRWRIRQFTKDRLAKEFDLSTAKFLDAPSGNYYPIYKFGRTIYFPGVNDEDQIVVNGRSRTLGKMSRSALLDNADDITYVDLEQAPPVAREKYQDPRFFDSRDYERGYAGQKRIGSDNYSWITNRGRDKSGYRIPNPKEKLVEFYRDPSNLGKLADKVEDIYRRLVDTRDRVLSIDVPNTRPQLDDDYGYIESQDAENYSQALRYLGEAVRDYNRVLQNIPSTVTGGRYREYKVSTLFKYINDVRNDIDYIDECLGKIGR